MNYSVPDKANPNYFGHELSFPMFCIVLENNINYTPKQKLEIIYDKAKSEHTKETIRKRNKKC